MGKFDLPFMNLPEDSPELKELKERVHKKKVLLQDEKRKLFKEAGIIDNDESEKKTPEHIPSPEEVLSVIKDLTEKETTEIRRLEDEDGVYLLEVTVPGDAENELEEYAYMRKGQWPEGSITMTEIHLNYYTDGSPVGGKEVARFIDNEWVVL